jgi:hypothetical protein
MSCKSPRYITHIRVELTRIFSLLRNQSGSLTWDTRAIWSYGCRLSCWQTWAVNHILSPNYQPKPSDTRYCIFSPPPDLGSSPSTVLVWILLLHYQSTEWRKMKLEPVWPFDSVLMRYYYTCRWRTPHRLTRHTSHALSGRDPFGSYKIETAGCMHATYRV